MKKFTLDELKESLEKLIRDRPLMALDLNNLEVEFAEQADRHWHFLMIASVYRKRLEDAEIDLDVAEAKATRLVRQKPEKYGVDGKLPEQLVKVSVKVHPLYKEARLKVVEAKYALAQAENCVKASEHRKKAIENEVSLWSQGYFGQPKTSRLKHEKAGKRRADAVSDRQAFRKKER